MGNQVPALNATRSPCGSGVPEALSEWPQLLDAVQALNVGFPLLRVDVTAAVYLDRHKVHRKGSGPTPTQRLSHVLAECQWTTLMPVSLRKPPLYIVLKFKGASAVELLQCRGNGQLVSCGVERCAVLLNPQQFVTLLQLVRNITCTLAAGSQMGLEALSAQQRKRETAASEPSDSECSICLDASIDVALPCGHSYCRKCVAEWTTRSFRQALSNRDSFDGDVALLNCPSCRQELCTDADFVRSESGDADAGRSLSSICTRDSAVSIEELEEEAAQRADKELWHFATWDQSDLQDFVDEARERFFVLSRVALENSFEAAGYAANRMCIVTRAPSSYDKQSGGGGSSGNISGKELLPRQPISGGKRAPPKLPKRFHHAVPIENKV